MDDERRRQEDEYFDRLQHGIDRRQAETLSLHARRLALRASAAKVLLMILGAFSASKAATDQVFGADSVASLVVYSLAGILTATVAGLEAAFRWDRRSVDLGPLAARCVAHLREADTADGGYRSNVMLTPALVLAASTSVRTSSRRSRTLEAASAFSYPGDAAKMQLRYELRYIVTQ